MLALMMPVILFSCLGKGKDRNSISDALASGSKYYDSIRIADSIAENSPPVAIAFGEAINKANDGKKVIIEGYLSLPSTSYSSGKSQQLSLLERQTQFDDAFNFILSITTGSGKNEMTELKEGYLANDVKVVGKSGEAITIGDHVKITGKLTAYGSFASLDVVEIEKLDPVVIDYSTLNAPKLTSANIEDSALENKIVCIEGMLETPYSTMGGDYTFLFLKATGFTDNVTVDFAYGETAACLERLPENYKESDFKIHDFSNKLINIKKKVRIYGMLSNGNVKVESIQNI